ncbi:hypothetical protein C900_01366 [Fulvivirga imtechensis AK7]|uniref:DinB-like domain-containing protein n=1 Tax=Fulvivirga imtechensis AK7 TaxID=1237149 RepID=L8JXJ0_9BACT|nr:putative metal-dependent hydrolase [Fulvivirga imtechensis]ELR73756.1 hypothetical protein C900_01366 [Fulvivirga imtechensis AK7]
MIVASSDQLKYPIGKYQPSTTITKDMIGRWIDEIERLPAKLRSLVSNLSQDQLDTPYRPDGWTIRQVIHHIPDSHVNGYIRFKWALTEDTPIIKPYEEQLWAELFDSTSAPIAISLSILEALHAKWVYLLKGLPIEDLERTFIHPATNTEAPLKAIIELYAWHGQHHYMHIKNLLVSKNW